MAERKVKLTIPNLGSVEGTDVAIVESIERWTELKLEDGSILRVKPAIMSVTRIDGRYDPQGNPLYAIQGGQIMVVGSAPEHLRQQASGSSKVQ